MSEFFFSPPGPRRRRGVLLSYLLVGLIGAIIGGLLVVTVAPSYLIDRLPHTAPPPGQGLDPDGPRVPDPGDGTGPGDHPATAGTASYAYERVYPAVVGIVAKSIAYDIFRRPVTEQSSGSGVVFHQDGYIATNNHVVEGASELLVSFADGRVLNGTVVGTDPFTDLAVLKVDETDLPIAEFGDSDALRIGELAVAIGNPVGPEFARTATAGVISGLNRRVQRGESFFEVIQTDAAINPGNSGGPLVNGAGQVIGINTAKLAATEIEGIGFAIPINTARPILNELVRDGRVPRPWLGVRIVNKAEAERFFDVTVDRGVLVVEVIPRGPAALAGVENGDVILQVGSQAVETTGELTSVVQTHRPGERISLTVRRGEAERVFNVTLEEMPAG